MKLQGLKIPRPKNQATVRIIWKDSVLRSLISVISKFLRGFPTDVLPTLPAFMYNLEPERSVREMALNNNALLCALCSRTFDPQARVPSKRSLLELPVSATN